MPGSGIFCEVSRRGYFSLFSSVFSSAVASVFSSVVAASAFALSCSVASVAFSSTFCSLVVTSVLAFCSSLLDVVHAVKGSNDYPHLSVKDELRCTCDISLQIGLVLRLHVVVASRSRVSNIRPNGRADGHKVHPYSNPALLEFLGIACGKMRKIIFVQSVPWNNHF